jgi:hypothetical protein
MCVLIQNVDARSRNPRITDFDEIQRIVQANSDEYIRMGFGMPSKNRERYCDTPGSRLSVDHDAGIIKHYSCLYGSERYTQAYLNEIDFSKTTNKYGGISIPCMANRECVWGKTDGKREFVFFLDGPNKEPLINQIIELLKPN